METVGRVFLAVGFPPEVRVALAHHVGSLALPGVPVPPENLHVTLRFLGQIDRVSCERLVAGLDEVPWPGRGRIRIGDLGAFPSARAASVAWLSIDDPTSVLDRLRDEVEDVCEQVGLGREERPFRPHVTIARIRPPVDLRPAIAAASAADVATWAESVVLLRSTPVAGGVRYEPMERFPLPQT